MDIDIVLLQEVWHPPEGSIHVLDFPHCFMKLRQGREGGGVAILAHKSAKVVHLNSFDRDGLEAVWADVMVSGQRTVVGAVYIPPGDIGALDILDNVIGCILQCHRNVIIGIDANSRSALWDDSCIGISNYCKSFQMGIRVEDTISKYSLQIHNDGRPTFISGKYSTAPDITLSAGLYNMGKVEWRTVDEDLRSPHSSILVTFGDSRPSVRTEVIDWRNFDWDEFTARSAGCLQSLLEKWNIQSDIDADSMVEDLASGIHECVNDIAGKRIITKHSKPWISKEVSSKLKELRNARRRCRLRRSPVNVKKLEDVRQEVTDMINSAEHEWWLKECNKLQNMNEREKWKAIEKLTNQSCKFGIQPIRIQEQGKDVYLFDDDEIRNKLERHHISKESHINVFSSDDKADIRQAVQDMVSAAEGGVGIDLMNSEITDYEISNTFGRGSDTPGPDGLSAKLIDMADRNTMHQCIKLIWNKAWDNGYFIKEWKLENRVVIPKPGKPDYHDCEAYRTVSVTSCLGKRFECVTSRRLLAVLEDCKFDQMQFAYLSKRSSTQAMLVLVETIKSGLIAGSSAGVVFFRLLRCLRQCR